MREITAEGLHLIMQFEGFRAKPYLDAAGLPTIGYGHLIRPGEQWSELSQPEAQELLRVDVRLAEHSVLGLTDVSLTDGQFDALVSFVFNLGAGAYQRSTLRRKVNREEHDIVPSEFMRWIFVNGIKIKGLMRRRQAEAMRYLS